MTNKLHRATFSKHLAELIVSSTSGYEVREAHFIRGNKLKPGEKSRALYGLVATNKDLVLRVPLTSQLAELMSDDSSRHIEEIFLTF